MDSIVLEVEPRDKSIKPRDLLANNLLLIEFYGKGVENKSFQVDYQTFRRVYKKAGSNTIIELKSGGDEALAALVHDVTYHPATDRFVHIDMINVRMGEKLQTKIPLEFVGTSSAVKEQGGNFSSHLSEIDVECLPKDLIHNIEVDISSLADFQAYIRVKDLIVPSTIEILNDPEDVIANVTAPREEEAEAEVVEAVEAVEGEEASAEGEESAS